VGGETRGYDGGKKVCGRKRHLLVDWEGLVLKAKVHSAKVPDQDGIKLILETAGRLDPYTVFGQMLVSLHHGYNCNSTEM